MKNLITLAALIIVAGPVSAEPPPELARWLAPQTWDKDTAGPILSLGNAGAFDDKHMFAPAVNFEQGKYSMWYCGSSGAPNQRVFRLGLATSADGKTFEKFKDNPVLQFPDQQHSILTPCLLRQGDGTLVREDGKLRMWFAAARLGKSGMHTLHESNSADGIHWSEPSAALMENVYCPTILKTDRGYEMWYGDVVKRPWILRHARSADGKTWTVTEKPALQLTQEWEVEVFVYPTVLKVDGVYLMWYGSYDRGQRRQTTAIGFAASLDGTTWHKYEGNPVISPDKNRPWESNYVGSGSVLRLPDGSFRYWYASRKAPPFNNLYFAINTAKWAGPGPLTAPPADPKVAYLKRCEDAKRVAIAQAKPQAAEEIRKNPAPLLRMPFPPKKGDVGTIDSKETRRKNWLAVEEVIDDNNAIIRAWYVPTAGIVDEPTFIDVWVTGVKTADMTAGDFIKLPQVFHMTGNKTFSTDCGGRTVPLLEVIEIR